MCEYSAICYGRVPETPGQFTRSCGRTVTLERNADNELGLVLFARQQLGVLGVYEVVLWVRPVCKPEFRNNVDDKVDVNAGAHHDAVHGLAYRGHPVGSITDARQSVPCYAAIDEWVHDLGREPVLEQQRKLPIAIASGLRDRAGSRTTRVHRSTQRKDVLEAEVAVNSVTFDSQAQRQV